MSSEAAYSPQNCSSSIAIFSPLFQKIAAHREENHSLMHAEQHAATRPCLPQQCSLATPPKVPAAAPIAYAVESLSRGLLER